MGMKYLIDKSELNFSFARSSGPGGQNVNKVNSKAILHWSIKNNRTLAPEVKSRFVERYKNKINSKGEVVIAFDNSRDQQRNIELCCERLNEMILSVLVPPKKRKKTKPTKAAKEKRIKSKKLKSAVKKQRSRPEF